MFPSNASDAPTQLAERLMEAIRASEAEGLTLQDVALMLLDGALKILENCGRPARKRG